MFKEIVAINRDLANALGVYARTLPDALERKRAWQRATGALLRARRAGRRDELASQLWAKR